MKSQKKTLKKQIKKNIIRKKIPSFYYYLISAQFVLVNFFPQFYEPLVLTVLQAAFCRDAPTGR